jgi:hypothetical protein
MDGNRINVSVKAVPPDSLIDFFPAQDLVFIFGQVNEDLKFTGGQVALFT